MIINNELVGTLEQENERLRAENDQLYRRCIEAEHERDMLQAAQIQAESRQRELEYANHELRNRQTLFQTLIDSIPAAIAVRDRRGRFLLANRHMVAQLHVDCDEIIGKADYELLPEHLIQQWRKSDQPVLTQRQSTEREESFFDQGTWHTLLTNRFPLFNDHGSIYGIGSIATDITERKQMEEQLQLAQFALDSSTDGIQFANRDAQIVYANQAFATMLGYQPDELQRLSVLDVDPELTLPEWQQLWDQLKQHQGWRFERQLQRKDGSCFPSELVNDYLGFNDCLYICTFVRDITERKRAEQEQAALHQQIIDAQREAIRQLRMPIIPMAHGVLLLPCVGALDRERMEQMLATLLNGVAAQHARVVILDMTGVATVETGVGQDLMQLAQAVQLLGAQMVLTGISPLLAEELVQIEHPIKGIVTHNTLQAGVAYVLQQRRR
ncbi:MAG: PAS domain S-box protein [Chloroflexaceae bacterium]|nr:PAS domain S-box protein [Chloroflexaceae bacterium]